MRDSITWVALDTSKKKHVAAILNGDTGELRERAIINEPRTIRRFARRLVREAAGQVRVCYEAGPCGFALQRQLKDAAPGLECAVIAPSLIPVRPGQRIKTDKRDARKLVGLFQAGELTVVRPPTEAEESVRDLMRCREAAKADLLRARHRLAKFLLRRGHIYTDGKMWSQKYEKWLGGIEWDNEVDRVVFEDYLLAISQADERHRALVAKVEALSQREPYHEAVGWLTCFRGISVVTAMTILAELHGFERFQHPRSLMAYLGLIPSEHSSAERVHRGAITKTGNSHVRHVLIEAAWHCRLRPRVGVGLRKRRQDQPSWAINRGDKAMVRLYRRYHHLRRQGKQHNKAVVAVARELIGFIWAMLWEGKQHQQRVLAA
jgi:transposase